MRRQYYWQMEARLEPPEVDPRTCGHYDKDDGICLDCGKDLREDLMADAYDRAKDRIKYGDE